MIFTQHYLACLSHASYLIGDETTGRAVVVDPRRDVGVYLGEAADQTLHIERVIETHIHADFLSGHLELANSTGAVISYGEGADVEFPIEPMRDGQRLSLGEVTLEILATPGHTPESICITIYERPGDQVPYGVLTGDTLFVGDVGRPSDPRPRPMIEAMQGSRIVALHRQNVGSLNSEHRLVGDQLDQLIISPSSGVKLTRPKQRISKCGD